MKQKHNVPFWDDSLREEVEGQTIEEGILLWAFSRPVFAMRTLQSMLYLDPYFGGDPEEGALDVYRTPLFHWTPRRYVWPMPP